MRLRYHSILFSFFKTISTVCSGLLTCLRVEVWQGIANVLDIGLSYLILPEVNLGREISCIIVLITRCFDRLTIFKKGKIHLSFMFACRLFLYLVGNFTVFLDLQHKFT